MDFQACFGSFLQHRCEGMNSKWGLNTVVVFLSVSVDPGSSSWMVVLAVTRGSFDCGAVVGER